MKDLQNIINNSHCGGHLPARPKYVAPKDTQFRDVVVIGNGPSGISLSYMLSGNFPYWTPAQVARHPDEILRARLDYADATKSLVEQDLVELAEGLEGRSTNPVSLLLDNLTHPCADLGMNLPSMLHFKHCPGKQLDHIVLGKGPPGGAWHRMDPNLRTLSLSAWMSLPGLDFATWQQMHPEAESQEIKEVSQDVTDTIPPSVEKSPLQRRNLSLKQMHKGSSNTEVQSRALISRVAEYYESYVKEMGLEKNFWNDVTVTNVFPVRIHGHQRPLKSARWMVVGTRNSKPIHIACRSVVLANGSSDMANRLGLRVESLPLPWIKHELPQLEAALEGLSEQERKHIKPVLIVGAGLSAADAVTICRQSGVPVVHVYRSRTAGLDKMLPENVYPEYHEVHKMMKDPKQSYDYYTPVPEHAIAELHPVPVSPGCHRVRVRHLVTGESRHYEISFCAILIGARPDLRFLNASSLLRYQAAAQVASQGPLMPRQTNGVMDTTSGTLDCYIEEDLSLRDDAKAVSRLAKQISWFKVFCAKCRHINVCERPRRNDYRRICGHNNYIKCECPALKGGGSGEQQQQQLSPKGLAVGATFDDVVLGLGEDPAKPIDGKNNPIAVDKYTNQVLRAPRGLYAMGPLVGDNFVRFIPGGALAITASLHRESTD